MPTSNKQLIQIVSPQGAHLETKLLIAFSALVIAISAALITLQRGNLQNSQNLLAHQIPLASGQLVANAQGIYIDLQAVHEEWLASGAIFPPPAPEYWANDVWQPFVKDVVFNQRGLSDWKLSEYKNNWIYTTSFNNDNPFTILWIIEKNHEKEFNIWIHEGDLVMDNFNENYLIKNNWRQIVK